MLAWLNIVQALQRDANRLSVILQRSAQRKHLECIGILLLPAHRIGGQTAGTSPQAPSHHAMEFQAAQAGKCIDGQNRRRQLLQDQLSCPDVSFCVAPPHWTRPAKSTVNKASSVPGTLLRIAIGLRSCMNFYPR